MKEMQMFPQITEETEENLLTLDDDDDEKKKKKPLEKKSPSPLSSTAAASPVDAQPSSPPAAGLTEENHALFPVPKITAEDLDSWQKPNNVNSSNADVDEFASPPARVRMRSLSGGAYRLSPAPPAAGRMRRQSGDDVLTGLSPSRRAAGFIDAFRPRSKSDSKSKKPTFLSTLKNSIFSKEPTLAPLVPVEGSKQRSETKSGPMSKMIDMFRSRSNSISLDQRSKNSGAYSSQVRSGFMRRYSIENYKKRHPQVTTHRSLELPSDRRHHHHLSRRSETVLGVDYEDCPLVVPIFFDVTSCSDVMPVSGKVVVLEVNLKVEKAFYSLVENAMRAAPVWDSSKMEFIGMLTITDFIDVLLYYSSSQEEVESFEGHKISTWRRITEKQDRFVQIAPDASLTDAIKILVDEKIHRLPIFDPKTQTVLYILTHKRILRHFQNFGIGKEYQVAAIFPKPRLFRKTIEELELGTYENIAMVSPDMTVIEALRIFRERRVSALPVVENNVLVDIYAKFDAFALATKKTYRSLSMTIKEALQERGGFHEEVVTCSLNDTLQFVVDRIVETEVHRIVVAGPKLSVIGIISLSDIIRFIALKPLEVPDVVVSELSDAAPAYAEAPQSEVKDDDGSSVPVQAVAAERTENERALIAATSSEDDVFDKHAPCEETADCSASLQEDSATVAESVEQSDASETLD